MDTPHFRLATSTDCEQLAGLRASMQLEVGAFEIEDMPPNYLEIAQEYFQKGISNQTYISSVAEVGGILVAAVGVVIYEKPPSIPLGRSLVGYVTNVFTRPSVRKRGIASNLMSVVIEKCRELGVSKLHLGTTEDGKRVYEKVGFGPLKTTALELKLNP